MPITPSSFKRLKKPLTFTFADEPVHIEYYPAAFGSDALNEWNAVTDAANAAKTDEEAGAALLQFGQLICRIVASWDYCEDPDPATPDVPGAPVPLTPERILVELQRYPLFFPDFLYAIVTAIGDATTGGKVSGTTPLEHSDATSSKTGSLTNSPAASSLDNSASSLPPDGSVVEAQP